MSVHDGLRKSKELLVAAIARSGNVRAACRELGIHHSTYYRWRRQVAHGRPTQPPRRVQSWAAQRLEQAIIGMALANPELGPRSLADELAVQQDIEVSASRVWRTLRRHRLNTAELRYALLLVHREGPPPPARPPQRPWVGSLDAEVPGDLIQFDCFYVGKLKETRLGAAKTPGVVWQYTAIDVASSYVWAELHSSPHNPSPVHTTALAHRVAADLVGWGWKPKAISTDNGNEFVAATFTDALTDLGIAHRRIKAGRPQTNGKVEQVHYTILKECLRPSFLAAVEPSITGLRRDLADYLGHYNHRRRHHGKWNQGRPPIDIVKPSTKLIHP